MKILREYQRACLTALVEAFTQGQQRALVVMASGLGKTVVAAHFVRNWFLTGHGRVLFIMDQTDPLRQARAEFDEALQGLGVTTGIDTSDTREKTDAKVLFTTFQSMRAVDEEFKPAAFELVIVDEAHHGQAATYSAVINYFIPRFRFGMTATPERTDGRDIGDLFGDEVYNYPLAKALADRKLAQVDYRVMTDNLSFTKLRELIRRVLAGDRRVSRKQIDDTIFLEERLVKIVRIVRGVQGRRKKTIIFCRSVEHLEMVHDYLPEAVPYHSRLHPHYLAETYADFRNGKRQTILVVDKFNEGVDIPEAEVLVFLRATDSGRVWLQQLGRGLRLPEGAADKIVTVLDFVANCDRIATVNELGLEVAHHMGGGKPEAVLVRGKHFNLTFTEEVRNLLKMLERLDTPFYETWEEASEAAQKLRIKFVRQYSELYKNDPRLPRNPDKIYASGWKERGGVVRVLGYYEKALP